MSELPPPDVSPVERVEADTPRASTYGRGDEVWVYRYRTGRWHRGVVTGPGEIAATVSLEFGDQPGTAVDVVMPDRLAPRRAKAATDSKDAAG